MTTAVDVDRVFVALADPTRRRVLELLGRSPSTASALARELPVTRQGILKHLGVLRDSGLVTGVRAGREVRFQVRPESLVATASWMTSLAATWDERLALLKRQAEQS
ncbi:ArsR/SmtB family transcription factor [Micromonospora sp. IBHARD004]|uniref:ArsR/SmtB family transcription factor n=1 Tax=Micromonospora sp. IBHARD004 TaxID=3457764 RepID=UPI00405A3CE0